MVGETASINVSSSVKGRRSVEVNIKTCSYTLNVKALCKKKLKIIDRKYKILRKDKGNQYSVHLSTVTYFILVKSMAVLGKKHGLKVKRLDVDQTGNDTQAQFEVIVLIGELEVPIKVPPRPYLVFPRLSSSLLVLPRLSSLDEDGRAKTR